MREGHGRRRAAPWQVARHSQRAGSLVISLAISLAISLVTSCVSDPMRGVRESIGRGDYLAARDTLLQAVEDDPGNAHLFRLELGVVFQAQGDPAAAVAALRRARDGLDANAEGNYTDWIASVFLDDRSRVFPGADYEHVVVRAMLAAADLMAGGHDAYAYAFQVLEKQQAIIRSFDPGERASPKADYRLVAFGNYLRAIINEESARDRSEARREYAKVQELAPQFRFAAADLQRATQGRFAAPGHGVVHVLALVGRGPFRVQVEERATRDALAIAQLIWSVRQNRPFLPNVVPLPLPALAFHQDNPESVAIFAGGERLGDTAVITDVESMAQTEFEVMRPWVMARAVVRRLLKTVVVEAGKEVIEHETSDRQKRHRQTDAMQLAVDLVGNLWAASESADLRCWNLLPATFQVLRLELPAGEHEISLRATCGGNVVGCAQTIRVQVLAGYNTYVLGVTPTVDGGPTPMSSR